MQTKIHGRWNIEFAYDNGEVVSRERGSLEFEQGRVFGDDASGIIYQGTYIEDDAEGTISITVVASIGDSGGDGVRGEAAAPTVLPASDYPLSYSVKGELLEGPNHFTAFGEIPGYRVTWSCFWAG
jgi:hypothetical protein